MAKVFEKDIAYLENNNSWQSKMGIKITKVGIIPVPLVLLRFKRDLGFKYSDILFIGLALMYKQGGKPPYFSLAKLNRDFGIPSDTSNRIVKRLKIKGYLKTIPRHENPKGRGRNSYDLSPLFEVLNKLIDINRDKFFETNSWTEDDMLDYGLLKHYESEQSENRNDIPIVIGEDNKT